MNKMLYSLIIILPSLVPGAFSQVEGQSETNVSVFAIGSGTTHQIELKGIEGQIPVSNFLVKPQSVVQVKQGENIVVFTQPITQIVESVKVQDQKGVIKELESLGNNVYSLAGIPLGAHILDVIVDLGPNKKGAYETILVILEQGQPPVQPAQIIKQIQPRADVIIFDEDNCRKGFVLVNGNCEPIPIVCKEGFKLDPNSQKCVPWPPCKQGYQSDGKGKCVPIPIVCKEGFQIDEQGKCIPRYCDENTPVGQVCRDEGEEVDFGKTPTPEPAEGIPDVPEEGGEDNDSGNEDNGSGDLEPDPEPEPEPEDNQGSDTDTDTG